MSGGRTPGSGGGTGGPGAPGANGLSFRYGAGVPGSGLGINGDSYLNTTNGDVYGKSAGLWVLVGSLKGADGAPGGGGSGSPGADGAPGASYYAGAGVPASGLGINGDSFMNATNGDVYTKAGGAWSLVGNVAGPSGAPGPRGYSYLSAAGVPGAGVGSDGDTYMNATNGDVYAKSGGAWSLIGNVAGPSGGSVGPAGAAFRSGTGVPSSGLGSDGDTYLNTSNGDTYSKAAGAWTLTGNLRGPAGSGAAIVYDVYSGLRSHAGVGAGSIASTIGAATVSDRGGGTFDWVVGTRPAQDNMTVIYHDTVTTGYWKRRWDGRRADLAWAGLSATAGTAALSTALTVLAGLFVSVDKMYTGIDSLVIPAATRLVADVPEMGFTLAAGATGSLLSVQNSARLRGLTLDGNSANAGSAGFGHALVRAVNGGGTRPNVESCVLRNSKTSGVYARRTGGIRVYDTEITNMSGIGVFTQVSSDVSVIQCRYTGTNDGFKLHGQDGSNTTYVASNIQLKDSVVDYSGLTLPESRLAIELWGGGTGGVKNFQVSGNHCLGATSATGTQFGLSLDHCRDGVCIGNVVDGGPNCEFNIGIEGAGCERVAYADNIIQNYSGTGYSFSRTEHSQLSVVGGLVKNNKAGSSARGVQLIDNGRGASFVGVRFVDCGTEAILFNNSGADTIVSGCDFVIQYQDANMRAVYVTANASRGVISNCKGYRDTNGIALADQGTGTVNIESSGGSFWVCMGNNFDGRTTSGAASSVNGISLFNVSEGWVVIGNIMTGYARPVSTGSSTGTAAHYVSGNLGPLCTNGTSVRVGTDIYISEKTAPVSTVNIGAVTLTAQPNSEAGVGSAQYHEASGSLQVRVVAQVTTASASANSPRLYPQYSTNGGSSWTTIGSSSASLSSAGYVKSGWNTLPSGAQADVIFRVASNGGNASASPVVAGVALQFR